MDIHKLETLRGASNYYDSGFRIWFDSFLPYLNMQYHQVEVTDAIAYKYQGDFYGLLETLSVEKVHQYFIMVFNELSNPVDYDGVKTSIKIPDTNEIDNLRILYSSLVD